MGVWNYEQSVERKCSTGGTALKAVEHQIDALNNFISEVDAKLA